MFWQQLRESYFAPEKLALYAGKALQIVLIVLIAGFLAWLAGRILTRILRGESRLAERHGARTVIALLRSITRYAVFFVAAIMILRVLGVDFSAILAGAGVIGLAVGFGAQALVRDFLAGLFLLFEDSVNVGDFITAGGISGTVEMMGLRRTEVRAFDGTLYTIPNGELATFGNKSRDYMRAIVKVDLAYEQDAERGMAVARRVADEWQTGQGSNALDRPEVHGLLSFGESGLTIRIVARVKPGAQWAAERELRVRLKKAFDATGVEVPFPRQVVYLKNEDLKKS